MVLIWKLNAYINVFTGMRNIKMFSPYPVIGLLDQWTWDNSRSQISSSSVQPTKRFFFRPPFPCEESKLGTGLRIQNYLHRTIIHPQIQVSALPLSIPFLSLVILHLTRAPWNWRILLNEKLNAREMWPEVPAPKQNCQGSPSSRWLFSHFPLHLFHRSAQKETINNKTRIFVDFFCINLSLQRRTVRLTIY